MVIAAAVALQPAPPPPPRLRPDPPVAWSCEVADPQWRRFTIRGRIDGIPLERRPGYSENGTDAVIEADSSNRFLGTHRVYRISAGVGGSDGWYNLIVRAPERVYFHFRFEFHGETELGSVTIEQQVLGQEPNRFRAVGAGFCRVSTLRGTE